MWKTGTNLCDMINHGEVNRHMKGVANPLPVKASREPNGSGVPKFIQRRLPNRSLNPFAPGLAAAVEIGHAHKVVNYGSPGRVAFGRANVRWRASNSRARDRLLERQSFGRERGLERR